MPSFIPTDIITHRNHHPQKSSFSEKRKEQNDRPQKSSLSEKQKEQNDRPQKSSFSEKRKEQKDKHFDESGGLKCAKVKMSFIERKCCWDEETSEKTCCFEKNENRRF